MKKTIIASVVGGILLFFWQFLSWGPLNLHQGMQSYTPNQQSILDSLDKHLDDGFYFLPTTPKDASAEEMEKARADAMGKPWALIQFHKKLEMNMPLNMARGLIIDIICIFLLCTFLLKNGADMKSTVISCVVLVLIGYFTITYTYNIWYQTKTIPDLVDAVVSWGLVGVWLGWWLNRK